MPNFSKIMEKIVAIRLTNFLDENAIIFNFQFWFWMPFHFCILSYFLWIKIIQALNKKEHSIAIFCDLRKAFDTVDHRILSEKLSN